MEDRGTGDGRQRDRGRKTGQGEMQDRGPLMETGTGRWGAGQSQPALAQRQGCRGRLEWRGWKGSVVTWQGWALCRNPASPSGGSQADSAPRPSRPHRAHSRGPSSVASPGRKYHLTQRPCVRVGGNPPAPVRQHTPGRSPQCFLNKGRRKQGWEGARVQSLGGSCPPAAVLTRLGWRPAGVWEGRPPGAKRRSGGSEESPAAEGHSHTYGSGSR